MIRAVCSDDHWCAGLLDSYRLGGSLLMNPVLKASNLPLSEFDVLSTPILVQLGERMVASLAAHSLPAAFDRPAIEAAGRKDDDPARYERSLQQDGGAHRRWVRQQWLIWAALSPSVVESGKDVVDLAGRKSKTLSKLTASGCQTEPTFEPAVGRLRFVQDVNVRTRRMQADCGIRDFSCEDLAKLVQIGRAAARRKSKMDRVSLSEFELGDVPMSVSKPAGLQKRALHNGITLVLAAQIGQSRGGFLRASNCTSRTARRQSWR